MDGIGWDGWDGWILLRSLVQLEHLAVLINGKAASQGLFYASNFYKKLKTAWKVRKSRTLFCQALFVIR